MPPTTTPASPPERDASSPVSSATIPGARRETDGAPSGAPSAFVSLTDIDPTIVLDVRYATAHNFMGTPVDGYAEQLCLLTRPAAEALRAAQTRLRGRGLSLKVYDGYRPQRAVDHFIRWARDLGDQAMRAEFYPRVDKARLFDEGYIDERSGHSRGSTVDVTLVELPVRPQRAFVPGEPLTASFAPVGERFPDNSLDMGTGYDCFDTLSHTDDPRIRGEQRANRDLLRDALEEVGFTGLVEEWWHFTHRPELFPDTYFDFPVRADSLCCQG